MKTFYLCVGLLFILVGVYCIEARREKQGVETLSQIDAKYGKVCSVHKVRMKKDVLPYTPGSSFQDKKAHEAGLIKMKLFPNSWTEIHAWDVVPQYESTEVLYCEKCREAEAQWKAAQK